MSIDVCVKAPAKVNIGLKVDKKRHDGFHSIESIFQAVDFYDELKIHRISKAECIVNCSQMSLPQSNTLTKAYEAFRTETNIDFGVEIELNKLLPSGGGLGGGSSDGAALIKGLSELAEIELTRNLADSVASKVGSDVFFFLHCGYFENGCGAALVSGRGEFVEPIKPRRDLTFLMVFPEIHSSTVEAYSLLDTAFESGFHVACPEFSKLESLYNDSPSSWRFKNSFTPVLVNKYPLLGEALKDIKKYGADWAEMSGSGATLFGVFESELAAKKAVSECQKKWKCVLTH